MRDRSTRAVAAAESETLHEREFNYTDADFERVCALVYKSVGIRLSEAKRDLVYGRLARRIRQLELGSFREYLDVVEAHPEREFTDFVNAITTNLTSFFRERHHFDALRGKVLPELMRARAAARRVRIWSAGCSTGEEPYSLAMTVADAFPPASGWDVKILATDLDTNVLAHAREGVYAEDRLRHLPDDVKSRWLRRGRGANGGNVRVAPELQRLVTFNQLNLMESWPMRGPFDVIFCRNVVIYFDKPTQTRLFERFADMLSDDGYLFVGHSETLYRVTDRFELIGQTIYRKTGVPR
jgi:chemotaxis protein methyltransferase CheR